MSANVKFICSSAKLVHKMQSLCFGDFFQWF